MQQSSIGAVQGGPLLLLRLENLAVLIAAILAYRHNGSSWWLFGLLFLMPDICMLGYAANAKIGAYSYNIFHNFFLPLILAAAALLAHYAVLLAISLIWIAHIGFDRALGYGLKYPTSFGDTHLGRLGKA